VNELKSNIIPLLEKEGWMRDQENIAKQPCSRSRGGQIGEILRPEEFRRSDHPGCGASEASRLFINAASTPPFQGGEYARL